MSNYRTFLQGYPFSTKYIGLDMVGERLQPLYQTGLLDSVHQEQITAITTALTRDIVTLREIYVRRLEIPSNDPNTTSPSAQNRTFVQRLLQDKANVLYLIPSKGMKEEIRALCIDKGREWLAAGVPYNALSTLYQLSIGQAASICAFGHSRTSEIKADIFPSSELPGILAALEGESSHVQRTYTTRHSAPRDRLA